MLDFRRIKKYSPPVIILLFLFVVGGVFWFRSPVLVVTDPSFNQLYGSLRLTLKGAVTSIEFFRRFTTVTVAESAGPDLMSLAVEGSSRTPKAVLFPFRYLAAAQFYKESHPGVPVLVVGGRNPRPREKTELSFICTDTAQDLYRAGLCAASFAGKDKGIVFFMDGVLSDANRKVFQQGLRDQGFSGDPVYLNASADYSANSNTGCVVLAGPASKFVERNLTIPVILFSWIDPGITPRSVKLIFDDSPMAMAAKILKPLPPPGETFIASEPDALGDRMAGKKDFRNIQHLVKENYQKN